MEENEILSEFLIESAENLARLEKEIVELEQRPDDPELLASIFRTIHTVKGTCGFLLFSNLEGVTHVAENLLSKLRNSELALTPAITSLILATVDAVKSELSAIESTGAESGKEWTELRERLTLASIDPQPKDGPLPKSTESTRTTIAAVLETIMTNQVNVQATAEARGDIRTTDADRPVRNLPDEDAVLPGQALHEAERTTVRKA